MQRIALVLWLIMYAATRNFKKRPLAMKTVFILVALFKVAYNMEKNRKYK